MKLGGVKQDADFLQGQPWNSARYELFAGVSRNLYNHLIGALEANSSTTP
jgi:hypothetical protein